MSTSKAEVIDVEIESQRDAEAQLQFQEFTPSSSGVAELDVKTFPNDHSISSGEMGNQSDMESKEAKDGWLCSVHQNIKYAVRIPLIDLESMMKCTHPETSSWALKPVLSFELTTDVQLLSVYVGRIVNTKKVSQILDVLNSASPILCLNHLKRVANVKDKGLCVILLVAGELSAGGCVDHLKRKGFYFDGLDPIPFKMSVPATSPRTRKQYENALATWPCNFCADKYIEKLIDGSIFDQRDRKLQEHFMEIALIAAQKSLVMSGAGVGCVVVDSVKNCIVAIGYDTRLNHPLRHAAMVVADLIARTQGGGRWPVREGMWCLENKKCGGCKRTWSDCYQDFSNDDQYYCTGYDVYLTREPCLMCAMALIHCRTRRLFFGCFNRGALGGAIRMHEIKEMNHHMEIFCGILEEKCTMITCES